MTIGHGLAEGRFAELLDDEGHLGVAALLHACLDGDVELGTVTDEALLLCGRDAGADPRPHWSPWLGRDDVDVEVARSTAARWLQVRGLLVADPQRPDVPQLRQPLATLSWALEAATGTLTYETELRDGSRERGGVFVLPDGLALHDHIDVDLGLHRLVFRTHEVQAAWLAALLDPAACSRRTEPPVTAATAADLGPAVGALPGRPRSRTAMAAVARVDQDRYVQQAITAVGTSRGLWLLQAREDTEPGASLQQVGPDDVAAVAAHLVALPGPDA